MTGSREAAGIKGMRLQKWLAQAGLCSRREGERWIETGRVAVNGTVITRLGTKVMPGDTVAVDGTPVETSPPSRLVLAIYKPKGVICSRSDPQGRETIYDLLPPSPVRFNSVGRLDYLSEGILLLTNDGLLAHRLTHPRNRIPRVYRVKVRGRATPELEKEVQAGVTLEDGPTGPIDARLNQVAGANSWWTVTLFEGRNRIIRRLFAHFDMDVARLLRISYGGIPLAPLEKGRWRPLSEHEVLHLRRSTGLIPPQKPASSGTRTAGKKGVAAKSTTRHSKSGQRPGPKRSTATRPG